MIRALLAGKKHQTRRLIKPRHDDGIIAGPAAQPFHAIETWGGGQWNRASHSECLCCPYGLPAALDSDRLWVRETWRVARHHDAKRPRDLTPRAMTVIYDAGGFACNDDTGWTQHPYDKMTSIAMGKTRVSIFMPRWASRITLEITDVHVQRLRDISGEDAIAEGCDEFFSGGYDFDYSCDRPEIANYRRLWESLNGAGSWALNPWVFVIAFKRL